MSDNKKLNIVLDIGKTNVKLLFFNVNNKVVKSFNTKQQSSHKYGVKVLNSSSIYDWALQKIKAVEKKYPLNKFVCTAHACSVALIDQQDQEILACTDYEFPYHQLMKGYQKIIPKFNESFTPLLENGLNIGLQLYYLNKKNSALIKKTKYFLNYPQYISWKMTNKFASEISYVGCHSHLWDFKKNKLSSLVKKIKLEEKFPQNEKAWKVMGTKKIGNSKLQIINGVHDSNASYLYFKNSNIKNFTLISTGTWYIIFNQKNSLAQLNPNLDMLANIDVYGKAVPTMRFMGGREYDYLMEKLNIQSTIKPLNNFDYENYLIYPSFASGGAFKISKINANKFKSLKKGHVYYNVCLYIAFMLNFCLDKMNSKNTIILDGPITKNAMIMNILSTLRPKQIVLKNKKEIGTSLGATNLFDIKRKNKLDTVTIKKMKPKSLQSIYQFWEANLYKKELFSHP
jgi:sugar (pentulose or hexulose) kinase